MTTTERDMHAIYRGSHSPAQHFARIGYDFLVSTITDWERCPDDDVEDDSPGLQARWRDERVLAMLAEDRLAARSRRKQTDKTPRESVLTYQRQRIDWHLALPELKTWAGQSSLSTIIAARCQAIGASPLPDNTRLRDWTVPLRDCSGLDARVAPNALDDGFSVAALGMHVMTFAAVELLAIIGMAISPIVRYGYKKYGYVDPLAQWWCFRIVDRCGYYRNYTISERCGQNGARCNISSYD